MDPINSSAPTLPGEAQMRKAIAARDAAFDGRFVYGVITTGVYCRPSCKARPARPENIRFFADTAAAARAGLRACKRCRPDEAGEAPAALIAAARLIDQHADERLTLKDLAARAGLSPGRFQKAFNAAFGVSPKAYQDAARLKSFKAALKEGDTVTSALYGAGFGSPSRLYGAPARNIGMTPAAYRAGGSGLTLHYACRKTVLGLLLMAASERGVCFAAFGESDAALLGELKAEFPQARLAPSEAGSDLAAWMTALDDHLSRRAPRPDLPLDLKGTAFQILVWRFLLQVPEGEVVSYQELAQGIGKPSAVRAAASACAANRIAVLVPCHRALRGSGALAGYRWGLERKRALLDGERRKRAEP